MNNRQVLDLTHHYARNPRDLQAKAALRRQAAVPRARDADADRDMTPELAQRLREMEEAL